MMYSSDLIVLFFKLNALTTVSKSCQNDFLMKIQGRANRNCLEYWTGIIQIRNGWGNFQDSLFYRFDKDLFDARKVFLNGLRNTFYSIGDLEGGQIFFEHGIELYQNFFGRHVSAEMFLYFDNSLIGLCELDYLPHSFTAGGLAQQEAFAFAHQHAWDRHEDNAY